MRNETCPHESAVAVSSRSGEWDDAMLAHLHECPICTEVERVSALMRSMALQADRAALPDPDLIWIQAQILAREEAAGRELRTSAIVQTLRYGPFGAGAAWLAFEWSRAEGFDIQTWIRTVTSADSVASALLFALIPLGAAIAAAALLGASTLLPPRLRLFRFL